MTLSQYFQQRDTPIPESPVGKTMARILEKYPEMTFDAARAEAVLLLADAAKRRVYRAPQVLSVEQKAAQAASMAQFVASRKSPLVLVEA
jgi:hypothetical protein